MRIGIDANAKLDSRTQGVEIPAQVRRQNALENIQYQRQADACD
jgi:hypothetical protein